MGTQNLYVDGVKPAFVHGIFHESGLFCCGRRDSTLPSTPFLWKKDRCSRWTFQVAPMIAVLFVIVSRIKKEGQSSIASSCYSKHEMLVKQEKTAHAKDPSGCSPKGEMVLRVES